MSVLKTRTNQPVHSDDGIEDVVAYNNEEQVVEVGTALYVDGETQLHHAYVDGNLEVTDDLNVGDMLVGKINLPNDVLELFDGETHNDLTETQIAFLKVLSRATAVDVTKDDVKTRLFAQFQMYDESEEGLYLAGIYGSTGSTDITGRRIEFSFSQTEEDGISFVGTYEEV